jgi:hypothetical protein
MRKPLIAALATAATLLAAGAAHAGGNVQWSVGIDLPNVATVISNFPLPPLPRVVVQQAPVIYAPAPVVYAPAPVVYEPAPRVVYQRPVVVYQEPVVVYRPVPVYHGRYWDRGDRDGDGIPNRYDQYDNRRHGGYGDRDRDGIPNRYDRIDNRQYADRDHDGIPNRHDRRDDRKYRH